MRWLDATPRRAAPRGHKTLISCAACTSSQSPPTAATPFRARGAICRLSSPRGDAGQRPGRKGDPGEAGGDGGSQRPGQGGGVEKDGGDCCGVEGEEEGAGGGGEPGPVVAALAAGGERQCQDRQQQDSAEAQPGRAWQWPGPGAAEGEGRGPAGADGGAGGQQQPGGVPARGLPGELADHHCQVSELGERGMRGVLIAGS